MGRRPRPTYFRPRWPNDRAGARRWAGGRNEISARLSHGVRAWCRGTIPRPPDPRRATAPRRDRLTTRPAREPDLTGPSLRGGEPAALWMATGPGTNACRDGPGPVP